MDFSNRYTIYFGSTRGIIGYTCCKTGELANYQVSDTSQNAEITSMEWGRNDDEIIIGQKSGTVRLYSISTSKFTTNIDIDKKGAVVGAHPIEENIAIVHNTGYISIWNEKCNDTFSLNLSEDSTLESSCPNRYKKNIIGTGGEANDLKLWDIQTRKCIFKAKSMGHDNLNLPIPTSIRGICFVHNDGSLPACCTKEGHVLLYDERVQRRPISKFLEPKASYTTIVSTDKERECLVGTTKGYLQLIDLRSTTKCVATIKSFTGSITGIAYDPGSNVVATVSLDKFLRVHNIETKQLLYKEYLKQSLTKVLLRPIIKEESGSTKQNEMIANDLSGGNEEYDKLFANMETINDSVKTKRKRKSSHPVKIDKSSRESTI